MHELTIARSLIDLACQHARERGARRVTRIHIRLGSMSVVLRSLYSCFGPASRGTLCEGAALEIDEVPLSVHCRHCNATKHPAGRFNFRCPDCGAPTPDVLTGREMQLVGIDLDYTHRDAVLAETPTAPGIARAAVQGFASRSIE